MKIVEVIHSREWFNPETGATASIYGAVPFQGEQGAWIVRTVGYTWLTDTGTVGIGRRPASTQSEAEYIMELYNTRQWDKIRMFDRLNPLTP